MADAQGGQFLLRGQAVSGHEYYDAAGFSGRTVGLELNANVSGVEIGLR